MCGLRDIIEQRLLSEDGKHVRPELAERVHKHACGRQLAQQLSLASSAGQKSS